MERSYKRTSPAGASLVLLLFVSLLFAGVSPAAAARQTPKTIEKLIVRNTTRVPDRHEFRSLAKIMAINKASINKGGDTSVLKAPQIRGGEGTYIKFIDRARRGNCTIFQQSYNPRPYDCEPKSYQRLLGQIAADVITTTGINPSRFGQPTTVKSVKRKGEWTKATMRFAKPSEVASRAVKVLTLSASGSIRSTKRYR